MPEPEWFDQWIAHHVTVFGLDREPDLATFASWRNVFVPQGFTLAELTEATNYLATSDTPLKWREHHLAAIQRRIRDQRADRQRSSAREDVSFPACSTCGGCGWASVPESRCVKAGVWDPPQTCAVLCNCPWGLRERRRHESGKRRHLTLEQYQRLVPGWLDLLDRHSQLQLAEVAARATSAAADKLFGPILARIRRQKREPVPVRRSDPCDREPGVDEDEIDF